MIRSEHQTESVLREALGVMLYIFQKFRNALLPLCNVIQQMVKFPCIGRIETGFMKLRVFALGKHVYLRPILSE